MGPTRHFGLVLVVAVVMVGLVGGAAVVAHERQQTNQSRVATASRVAASTKPPVRLSTDRSSLDAGSVVAIRIRTSTRHPRPVRLQRWDARRKAWRSVTRRTVRGTRVVRVKPAAGTNRYRAKAPRLRHRAGGHAHTHRAGRSKVVTVTAHARSARSRPATLSTDEKSLLSAVTAARSTYARPTITAARNRGAEACLTTFARDHSRWMAGRGRAVDPGAAEHRAARRSSPTTACPGRTITAVTRAIGSTTALPVVIDDAIDSWLSSPYGETSRLLSNCHDAPAFEFGIAATAAGDARWLTVLVASDTSATKRSGRC